LVFIVISACYSPSVIGLYAGPEALNKELGIISEIELVHDGWSSFGEFIWAYTFRMGVCKNTPVR